MLLEINLTTVKSKRFSEGVSEIININGVSFSLVMNVSRSHGSTRIICVRTRTASRRGLLFPMASVPKETGVNCQGMSQ